MIGGGHLQITHKVELVAQMEEGFAPLSPESFLPALRLLDDFERLILFIAANGDLLSGKRSHAGS